MQNTIFIFHGAYGSPKENWIPWLQIRLEKQGCSVVVPKFPTPEKQNVDNWFRVFKKYRSKLNKNSILIGHSIGAAFLLCVLEKINRPAKAAFLVAPFVEKLNNSKFDAINKTFYKAYDWPKIKKNCKNFYVFYSENDPYVPIQKADFVAKKLSIRPIIFKNAGHFNTKTGYKKFPLLLKKVENLIEQNLYEY